MLDNIHCCRYHCHCHYLDRSLVFCIWHYIPNRSSWFVRWIVVLDHMKSGVRIRHGIWKTICNYLRSLETNIHPLPMHTVDEDAFMLAKIEIQKWKILLFVCELKCVILLTGRLLLLFCPDWPTRLLISSLVSLLLLPLHELFGQEQIYFHFSKNKNQK